MKFTFEDYVKAYNGDGESLTKLIDYKNDWFNHNSQPWCTIDIFDFTSDDIKKIVELDKNYDKVVEVINSYNDAVANGDIKFSKSTNYPLRRSVEKWLRSTGVSEDIVYLYYGRLSLSIYSVEHSLTNHISLDYYDIADRMVNELAERARAYMRKNDPMVSLNKRAFNLYDSISHSIDILKNIGWTTAGYKNCGASLVIYDEQTHKDIFLTKTELENIITVCETINAKINELSEEFNKKFTFKY